MNSVPYPEYVPEDFPCPSETAMVLGVYEPDLKGCFPINIKDDRVQIHACFPHRHRGHFAVKAARQAFRWIFMHLPQRVIYAEPVDLCAKVFARACGMRKTNDHYEVTRWAVL